jgi:hypothetical protein
MVNLPNIPVPSFGGGSYLSPSPPSIGSGAAREGGVGEVLAGLPAMPAMPSPAAPLTGGGGGEALPAPINGSIGFVGGIQERIANRSDVTINVAGGISSAADIGQSVVDALTQYTQVYGPLNLAIR